MKITDDSSYDYSMVENPKIAVVQMCSSGDPWENLHQVDAFVREAEGAGAAAVFFPENVLYRGHGEDRESAILGNSRASELEKSLREFSSDWKATVFLGSVLEASANPRRPYNSTLRLGRGRYDFMYRKIHLFDYQGEKSSYRESDKVMPGDEVQCARLNDLNIGLSICFDLRFPELYRKLVLRGGANALAIPAAFTYETGVVHWHTLLRSRAIENLCYVVASAQWGSHVDESGSRRSCFGHSLVYSPWGDVVCEAKAEGDALLVCELDLQKKAELRRRLPCLELARLA